MPHKVFEVLLGGLILVVMSNTRANRPKGSAPITHANDRKYKTLRWQDQYHDRKKERRQFAQTTENDS